MKQRVLDLAERIDRQHRGLILKALRASAHDPWDGRRPLDRSHRIRVRSLTEPALAVSVLISYDVGPHSNAGWWRNSQYDRCWHLSIVGVLRNTSSLLPIQYATLDRDEVSAWGLAVFGPDVVKAWNEPPATENDPHRTAEPSRYTWHTRLFTDRDMRPIIPEGEVYTLIPFDDGSSPEKVFRT